MAIREPGIVLQTMAELLAKNEGKKLFNDLRDTAIATGVSQSYVNADALTGVEIRVARMLHLIDADYESLFSMETLSDSLSSRKILLTTDEMKMLRYLWSLSDAGIEQAYLEEIRNGI